MKKPVKIAFVGSPGSGKSLLAAEVYVKLKLQKYSVLMPEEGATTFIRNCGKPEDISEGFVIMYLQDKNENDKNIKGLDFLICDCAVFLTYVYGRRHEEKYKNKKRYNFILGLIWEFYRRTVASYDFIFYISIEHDLKFNDGIRHQENCKEAEEIGEQTKAFLDSEKIRYFEIKGTLEERVNQVFNILKDNKAV